MRGRSDSWARGLSDVRVRRRYHFGTSGGVYVAITLLIAVGAFNSQNNLLFWTFGLALSVLIVSGIVSGSMLMGVEARREAIGDASVGDELVVRYRISNRNRVMPLFALSVIDDEFNADIVRWWERVVPTWMMRLLKGAPDRHRATRVERLATFVSHVAPGSTSHIEARAKARARGRVVLTGVRIESAFPFGLLKKSVTFVQHSEVCVRPRVTAFDRPELMAAIGLGTHSQSRLAGSGGEFFALREFREGDALRDVAWRASAKRGRAIVKMYGALAPAELHVEFTLRRVAESCESDEATISAAAGVAVAALKSGVNVSLGESGPGVGGGGVLISARASAHGQDGVLDALARIDLSKPTESGTGNRHDRHGGHGGHGAMRGATIVSVLDGKISAGTGSGEYELDGDSSAMAGVGGRA